MKKLTNLNLLLMVFATVAIIGSCKIKDPLEGFVVAVKSDAISAAHVFRLIDNKTGATTNAFENATVTLSGPGAANLYDADGRKNFKVVEGRIGICIRRGVNPSGTNPIIFTLNVDVPGYLSKSLEYSLKSLMPTNNTIALVNVNDLPSGASKKDTNITVPTTGITQPLVIKTATTATKTEQAAITLPAGTKFLDANGNAVSGNITASIIHTQFKDSTNTAMQTVESFDNNFKDQNGNDVKLSIIESEAFDISFTSTGKNTQTVTPSEPLSITFLDSNLVQYILEITKNADGTITKTITPKTLGVTTYARKVAAIQTAKTVTSQRFTIKDYANPEAKLRYIFLDKFAFSALFNKPYVDESIQITPEIDGTFIANTTGTPPSPNDELAGAKDGDVFVHTPFATTRYAAAPVIEYDLESEPNILKVYFGVDCTAGQVKRPVLPEGTEIYLIKEEAYNASLGKTTHGNKIYPEDKELADGTVWKKYSVARLETKNNKVYSVVYIPWENLEVGKEYRAAYYRAGKRQDNDVNNPAGKIIAPPAVTDLEKIIDMVVPNCN